MGALDAVEWEACLLDPVRNREASWFLRKQLIIVPPAARYFLNSPWLPRALVALDVSGVPLAHLTPELGEMVSLVVSQDNSCRYCYAATRSIMKILGYPEARIRRLEEDFLSADLTPADKAALEFARCVSRAAPLATCTQAERLLQAGYSADAVKELAFLTADNVFYNRLSTLPALPPEEVEMGTHWWFRVVRPALTPLLRPRRAPRGEFLQPKERVGPFATLINALDGLPGAPRLRAVIDAAWGSPTLGRRAKGLVFAVVARGIGCSVSEQEAIRLLVGEGMARADVDDALAHLSAPGLDALERAAMTLARESIWYQPAQIQRQARSIRSLFTRDQFVELIGISALANMLCRLGVTLAIGEQQR